jgi:hypothetical protein
MKIVVVIISANPPDGGSGGRAIAGHSINHNTHAKPPKHNLHCLTYPPLFSDLKIVAKDPILTNQLAVAETTGSAKEQ